MQKPSPGKVPHSDLIVAICLLAAIAAVYFQVTAFDFCNFDDPLYLQTPQVLAGLQMNSIRWAFTAFVASNWLPVTLISDMLDMQLFGPDAGMHHLMNVVYHAIATVLLFLFLRRATGSLWPSAFCALVFGVHPLHVESVAWMAERKDVLSAMFFFLSLYLYQRYVERSTISNYLWVTLAFCLSLMSKPTMVTFPFVLLLLDFWPFRRAFSMRLIWEKIPFAFLAVVQSVIAYQVQATTGAVAERIPWDGRIAKALLSYITYLRQSVWPSHLAVFYPYPARIYALQAGISLLFLILVSLVAILLWRVKPYFATGWFWYLGTLVPVIGIVKIGQQSHADRYMYIPMVGLTIAIAWFANELADRRPSLGLPLLALGGAAGLACIVSAYQQTSTWRNSETLYLHAIAATGDNWLAEGNLASYLMKDPQRQEDALEHVQKSLNIKPDNADAENNMGLLLMRGGDSKEAMPYFEAALGARPNSPEFAGNTAMCLIELGSNEQAIATVLPAVRANPGFAKNRFVLGLALSNLPGHESDAIAQYQAGLSLDPGNELAREQLAALLDRVGRTDDARRVRSGVPPPMP